MTPKTTHDLAVEIAARIKDSSDYVDGGDYHRHCLFDPVENVAALIESALREQRERDAKVCDNELAQYREAKAHLAACGAATCAAAIREGRP